MASDDSRPTDEETEEIEERERTPAKPPEESTKPSLEEIFLAGSQKEDPEFDEELMDLVRERQRGSVLRPIMMVLVIVVIGSVIADWKDELTYFFHPSEPVAMGDISEFPIHALDPQWEPPVTHNTYVSLQGLPTRISRGGEYEFFRLIGGEFYVQRKLSPEEVERSQEERLPTRAELMGMAPGGDREVYNGRGRLVAFEEAPQRFGGLKRHYQERYNTLFCEDYTERQRAELRRQKMEQVADNWALRFENADQEERDRRNLTPQPTQEELDDLLDRNPVCVHAFMIYDDQAPRDFWWYLVFSALLGLLMLYNVVKLYRWFANWLK